MLSLVKKWLNSTKKNYFNGVALYGKTGRDSALFSLMAKGETDFTRTRLQEELMAYYLEQTAKQSLDNETSAIRVRTVKVKQAPAEGPAPVIQPASLIPNPELYAVCKKEADDLYKAVMNRRAELFAMARPDSLIDLNAPDKIEARKSLAIEVTRGYQRVSELYDIADYVKEHGKLPYDPVPVEEDDDFKDIPDHLVKQTLDNLRKNYNKMKKREQTAERVALQQKHEKNIKNLETRWQSLKQKI